MISEANDFGVSVKKPNPADNYKRVPKKALNFEDEVSQSLLYRFAIRQLLIFSFKYRFARRFFKSLQKRENRKSS